MENKKEIIKILLITIVTIFIAVASNLLSTEDDIIETILLCFIPIATLCICFIKEKIWYLWFLCPAVFLPLGTFASYNYLIIYCLTLPIYIWYIFRKKIKISWNKIPIIDIPIIILLLYIIYVFISYPFGIGLNFLEDYYGGKGYLTILGASIAFILLSTLQTTSKQLGKLLTLSIPIIILFTLITTIKDFILVPEETLALANQAESYGVERNMGLVSISIPILQLLIIKYDIKEFIKKIWPTILGLGCCYGILISGFRSAVMSIVTLFILICILYKRWAPIFLLPTISITTLMFLSSVGYTQKLPDGIQRCLAPLEFIDINPRIRHDASGSTDWRVEMWGWALDDRELFIKDKVWGDGFSQDIYKKKVETYFHVRNIHERGDSMGNLKFAWDGQWHNAPISIINTLGYIGLSIFSIILIFCLYYFYLVAYIYRNSQYRTAILYYTLLNVIKILYFTISADTAANIIPMIIINISIVKILYCCAIREGLYTTVSSRKEYIPLSCRTAQAE